VPATVSDGESHQKANSCPIERSYKTDEESHQKANPCPIERFEAAEVKALDFRKVWSDLVFISQQDG